jgi:manganese/zinc/iron transport system substrate-binding protein
MNKFIRFTTIFLAFILITSSCSDSNHSTSFQNWMRPNGKVKVLSTTAMIEDLVKQVGGEFIDSTVLIKGELDPHSYQLVKGDDEKIAFADLIFYNGLGLEHGPSLQNSLSKNVKGIPLGDKIQESNPALILYYKGQIDPHIWMDISLWAKTIPYIVEALSKKDPLHAELYTANGNNLLSEMEKVDLEIKEIIQKIPSSKRYLVTTHDAFNYFTRAYLAENGEGAQSWHNRFAAPEGLAPESQISSTDIKNIINHLHKYQIHILFTESNVNRDSIRKIVQAAKEKGLDVNIATVPLYADAMGKSGSSGDSYLKMIRHDAAVLAKNLDLNGE